LKQDLPTAELDGLLDFGKERRFIENIGIGIVFVSAKGAKLTPAYANVGVVNVPLDIIGSHIAGMKPLGHRIGFGCERWQVVGT
jgi:hypothetical protein